METTQDPLELTKDQSNYTSMSTVYVTHSKCHQNLTNLLFNHVILIKYNVSNDSLKKLLDRLRNIRGHIGHVGLNIQGDDTRFLLSKREDIYLPTHTPTKISRLIQFWRKLEKEKFTSDVTLDIFVTLPFKDRAELLSQLRRAFKTKVRIRFLARLPDGKFLRRSPVDIYLNRKAMSATDNSKSSPGSAKSTPNSAKSRLPHNVTGYEKIRTVGKGSFGSAVLYKRKDDDSLVIIKEINIAELSQNERQMSLNEVNLLARLDHPNIISYYDSFYDGGVLMIEMEYAEGGTLAQLLAKQQDYLEEIEIMTLFEQMISAVSYLHDHHVLHRDLKSANIFLTKDNLVKIGDFGISKMMGTETKNLGANTILGTPYYLSPEMCEGKTYNEKSDVWALGCCLYEMACLQKPFDGSSLPALVNKIVHADYEQVKGPYSSDLKLLIREMLNTNPNLRPSATEVLKMVQRNKCLKKRNPQKNVIQKPQDCYSALYMFETEQIMLSAIPNLPYRINVKQISLGPNHFLLLTTDSQVFSWGENKHGQLGHGDRKSRQIPTKIPALQGQNIQKVAAGEHFSVFCADRGIVLVCGHRNYLGNEAKEDLLAPQLIDALLRESIVDISCGYEHAVGVTETGQVFVWGDGKDGKLGTGNSENILIPTQIDIPTKQLIANVKCGPDCTMLITVTGTVIVMGSNKHNKLNLNYRMGFFANVKDTKSDIDKLESPTALKPFPARVVDASLGWHHCGVLLENGHVHLFGRNAMGELGNGTRQAMQFWMAYKPVRALTSNVCVQLVCGDGFTMVATSDNELYFWGAKKSSELDKDLSITEGSDAHKKLKSARRSWQWKKDHDSGANQTVLLQPTLVMRLDAARTTTGRRPFIRLSSLACVNRRVFVAIDTSPTLVDAIPRNSNAQLTTYERRKSAPELNDNSPTRTWIRKELDEAEFIAFRSQETASSTRAEVQLKMEIEELKIKLQEQNNTFKDQQDQMALLHTKLTELQQLQKQTSQRSEPPPAYAPSVKPKTLKNPFLPEAKTRICTIC
ncbi:unnamed protein product [Bursaphelenchus xylophilus]|uniref:non-specific serine/threonine protein kinase n=1 Tax=Bursaphelenchus xylophilus TaxID=6326 RepID=A0A7I8XCQ5_BURXY|nr:unnamed protein product [Bursaphelenchus xylophilus]CAG9084050.1 unnamed protein product [Bursaphelenchus xylophilus]